MSEAACTCRRHAVDPRCPKHGAWRHALGIALVATFYVTVALAVVLTAHGAAV